MGNCREGGVSGLGQEQCDWYAEYHDRLKWMGKRICMEDGRKEETARER